MGPLILQIQIYEGQERVHPSHTKNNTKVKMPNEYLTVRNINHNVDCMLSVDQCIS